MTYIVMAEWPTYMYHHHEYASWDVIMTRLIVVIVYMVGIVLVIAHVKVLYLAMAALWRAITGRRSKDD
jgi:hypothetical protein